MNKTLNIPTINGPDKVYFGTRKDDDTTIYISKPTFDCEWYWSFGYLGNKDCHYHLKAYQEKDIVLTDNCGKTHIITEKRNINMRDALLKDYNLNKKIEANLWQFCELALTIYALKEVAEIFHCGGSYITTNPGKDLLKNNALYLELVSVLIPKQCQLLWDLISPA